jgi:hypothetical protein
MGLSDLPVAALGCVGTKKNTELAAVRDGMGEGLLSFSFSYKCGLFIVKSTNLFLAPGHVPSTLICFFLLF